jgi:hypothetical protein
LVWVSTTDSPTWSSPSIQFMTLSLTLLVRASWVKIWFLWLTFYNTHANTMSTWAIHEYFRRTNTVIFPNTPIQQFQNN